MSSKTIKQRINSIKVDDSIGWDDAIRDAKRHIERLRAVVAVCEEKKAAGEPWPGSAPNVRLDTPATQN